MSDVTCKGKAHGHIYGGGYCVECGRAQHADPNPWPRAGRFWLFRGWKR